MIGRQVRVLSTKYDGSAHREYRGWFVLREDSLVVTQTFAGQEWADGSTARVMPLDARGYFWEDRWYNVLRLSEPRKGLWGWYCDVATPAQFDGENLHFVDLDLDVLVRAEVGGGLRTEVRDEEEFQANQAAMAYPREYVEQARRAIEEILALVKGRAFPFDEP
jgi:protein associated with RNAse G/E